MNVLCIDGPARGNVHDIKDSPGGRFRWPSITSPTHDVVYYVHHFQIAGRGFRLASVHLMIDDIRPDDVFEFVVSDPAKETVIEQW